MSPFRVGFMIFAYTALSACGDASPPADKAAAGQASGPAAPGPWDTLAALPPESQPYGLDVYTAKCVSCHGDIGQGVGTHPALKGLTPTAMQKKLLDYQAATITGEKAQIMTQAVAGLSEAEIASVAMYAGE